MHLNLTTSYQAQPRNVRWLAERAALAAHDAETFGPGLCRVRAGDARALVQMLKTALGGQ